MNPALDKLHSYPFEKLKALLAASQPPAGISQIALHIGEPKHATPAFIKQALADSLGGLAQYPATLGEPALRNAIADWLRKRYALKNIDASTQVLPVNGSREALFAFAQTIVDRTKINPVVVMPNPFYQIYEGATILAGAEPQYLNALAENHFAPDFEQLNAGIWQRTQLIYVCSPDNPTGRVMTLDDWKKLFALSDKYGFAIASDECYSEIYFNENEAPLGALQAAQQLGRDDYKNLVVFSSLSKRSNVPGLRSGFVAGNAGILKKFLLYRTYHGGAMSPPTQAASIAAWKDEAHVVENRRLYREKFTEAKSILDKVTEVSLPNAGFYFWLKTPIDDAEFTRTLFERTHVNVLPGSYLAREAHGKNPGHNRVRIALVANPAECREGIQRLADFIQHL